MRRGPPRQKKPRLGGVFLCLANGRTQAAAGSV